LDGILTPFPARLQAIGDCASVTWPGPVTIDPSQVTELVTQGKTGKKLRIAIEGELHAVIERILARPRRATGLWLIQDEDGQRLTSFALRSRFDKARELAGVDFQSRDSRAKAATDTENLAHAQKLLGHKNRTMTERYTRDRKGEKVRPLK